MSEIVVKAPQGHIEVRNFSLSYDSIEGPVEAVTDTQIHVKPGEFVSIVGPSGCGKSTLLNAVAGFLKPTTGIVTVDGEKVNGPSAERGMVFQQYSLFPWKTVRENVEFGLKMRGMPRSQRERAARTLLGLAGLEAFEKHYPEKLSGGMKQRVGIVRALATGPKVLLLDEPFGALDAQTRVIMQQILTNMWQRLKISVLFVTHDIDEAIFLSDRVYCMTARPGLDQGGDSDSAGAAAAAVDDDVVGIPGATPRADVADPRGKHQGYGRGAQRHGHAGAEHRAARAFARGCDLALRHSRAAFPSHLAGEGGAKRRMRGSIGAFETRERRLQIQTPHPPCLRQGTFSARGEGRGIRDRGSISLEPVHQRDADAEQQHQ
ncbi:ABC-type nitrate/sulfonate/bicarbonate transport system ATPase subunit [Bradyrhizobium sp. LM3.6]